VVHARPVPPVPVQAGHPGGRVPGARIGALDGLRGVAALVVVAHHMLLTQPALAAPYLDPTGPVDTATWWAVFTPLHLFWAGPQAVLVFFVLSGLVLALPGADTGRLNLWDYYPRRLLRLYLPVWAAVGLAVGWAAVFPRVWPEGTSWWVVGKVAEPTASGVLDDLSLVRGPGQVNHVLWSLQWEVVYCLLLPLVLLVARAALRPWPVRLLAAVAGLVAGAVLDSLAVSSLALFVLGTLMALEHRKLADWAARRGPGWWAGCVLACLALLPAHWLVHALARAAALPVPAAVEDLATALQGLGAALTVLVAWLRPGPHRLLTAPVMQWLGSRSFSLYLVHLPVVASVVVVFGGRPELGAVLALTLLVVLPLTEVFYLAVERPSHRVARRVGRAIARRANSAAVPEIAVAAAETRPMRLVASARGGSDPAGAPVNRPAAAGSPG